MIHFPPANPGSLNVLPSSIQHSGEAGVCVRLPWIWGWVTSLADKVRSSPLPCRPWVWDRLGGISLPNKKKSELLVKFEWVRWNRTATHNPQCLNGKTCKMHTIFLFDPLAHGPTSKRCCIYSVSPRSEPLVLTRSEALLCFQDCSRS